MRTVRSAFLCLFLVFGLSLQAGPVRISFLDDEATLMETLDLLQTKSCKLEGLNGFKKAVNQFCANPLKLELGKFPPKRSGFYFFSSVSNLVAALPPKFCQIDHPFGINCFDTAILLTQDHMYANPQADESTGPFVVEVMVSTNEYIHTLAATPNDAFEYACPEWYRNTTENFIPRSLEHQRRYLIPSLQRFYVLPIHIPEVDLAVTMKRILNSSWKKMGLTFPKNCELVLCHSHLTPVELGTVHAGVLFQVRGHYVYLEKTGCAGPFVRLDFGDKADLNTWLAAHMAIHLGKGPGDYFVTFNDTFIERLSTDRQSEMHPKENPTPTQSDAPRTRSVQHVP